MNSEARKAWKEANPEKMKEYSRRYREAHREEINARNRDHRAKNKERYKEKYQAYRIAHKEERKAAHRAYEVANKEKLARYRHEYHSKNRERRNRTRRQNSLMKQYGMTMENYDLLLAAQGGECAICHSSPGQGHPHLVVDHCHTTGRVRGLLCHSCNRTIGAMNDDICLLRSAVNYLEHPPAARFGK